MGRGIVEDKAILLCNYFDDDMNRSITLLTFRELLDIMVTVSLRYSSTLATSSLDPELIHEYKM